LDIKAGAIILCTGFDPYIPPEKEYGYKMLDNVITLPEFRRWLELAGDPELVYRGKKIRAIAYIYCVGSRQLEGDNKFCSRICCTTALHTSFLVSQRFPDIRHYHYHRGMRSYGKNESLYTAALDRGDLFFQSEDEVLPGVTEREGELLVKAQDILTEMNEMEVQADLVVLVTAMMPRLDQHLVDILKVPRGRDRFFNEIHPKLKPVETVIDGIYIAGTCHFPKSVEESTFSSLSASIKAHSLIGKGKIELEPTLASIDADSCEWCKKCSEVCPFDAIKKDYIEGKNVAQVNKSACKGCGMCLPVCPSNSIQLIGYTDEEIEGMISALVGI
jgi:heterodisulfide reductase subunit A